MNNDQQNVVFALDGRGGRRVLDLDRAQTGVDGETLWVHLDRGSDDARAWLATRSGLDPLVVDALLAEETRPRCASMAGGTLLILRGVNLNPGADADDMVAIRIWIEPGRVVTSRRRRLMSVDDVREALVERRGPRDAGGLVVELTHHLFSRIAAAVAEIEDEADRYEAQVLEPGGETLRPELSRMRRGIILLRRYLAPQRDALGQLYQLKVPWLGEMEAQRLREEADRITRLVEDLDAARERAALTQEELASKLSNELNSRMYVLTVVAGIFLPLGFITGLLGINVGGVPLAENPRGFVWVSAVLVVVTVLEFLFFRWRRWV